MIHQKTGGRGMAPPPPAPSDSDSPFMILSELALRQLRNDVDVAPSVPSSAGPSKVQVQVL